MKIFIPIFHVSLDYLYDIWWTKVLNLVVGNFFMLCAFCSIFMKAFPGPPKCLLETFKTEYFCLSNLILFTCLELILYVAWSFDPISFFVYRIQSLVPASFSIKTNLVPCLQCHLCHLFVQLIFTEWLMYSWHCYRG